MTSKADYLAAAALFTELANAQPDDVPVPTPTPTPTPPPPPVDPFAAGTVYPARPTCSIISAEVLPGATRVNAKIQLDHASPLTVVGSIRCFNGTGQAHPDTTKAFFFRTGDPLEQTIAFDIWPMKEGQTVKLEQPNVPAGAIRGTSATITATASAVPQAPLPVGRPPMQFAPNGELAYQASGREVFESGLWLNRLAHGRTQVGNGETGWYDPEAFEVVGDDLLLKSFRRQTPMGVGSPPTMYSFSSSVLTGLMDVEGKNFPVVRPEVGLKFGSIEWVARMPTRIGSWSGLWLCSELNGYPQWPFEIDVHEGFTYDTGYWHSPNSLSCALHGGRQGSNKQLWSVGGARMLASDLGIPKTLDTDFHKHQLTIDPDFITKYTDGIETMRFTNPFPYAQGWYPIMDVAVKIASDAPYIDGVGDMAVRQVSIWRG